MRTEASCYTEGLENIRKIVKICIREKNNVNTYYRLYIGAVEALLVLLLVFFPVISYGGHALITQYLIYQLCSNIIAATTVISR